MIVTAAIKSGNSFRISHTSCSIQQTPWMWATVGKTRAICICRDQGGRNRPVYVHMLANCFLGIKAMRTKYERLAHSFLDDKCTVWLANAWYRRVEKLSRVHLLSNGWQVQSGPHLLDRGSGTGASASTLYQGVARLLGKSRPTHQGPEGGDSIGCEVGPVGNICPLRSFKNFCSI